MEAGGGGPPLPPRPTQSFGRPRPLRPIQYDTGMFDPAGCVAASLFVLALSAVSTWVPASKAVSMAPTEALRAD